MHRFLIILFICLITGSCHETKTETNQEKGLVFSLLKANETGIDFTNTLSYDNAFNVYTYRNYYNGGGVAIGDINNDGLQDIYFTANQEGNRLYLNQGNFNFKDISESSGTMGNKPWSTGVAMVDINADGLLDIYVCNSGDLKGENKQNELFINNGDLTFTEAAAEYNLDDKGFSTHASFFDYDKDGDLDAYILNNSYKAIGGFDLKLNERNKRDKLGGDKLMENQDGKFYDVSEKAGIYGSVIGFGLGVTVGDVNNDGWEDIYVSNDFFERDYLYINQQNGTFKESLEEQITATSGASMGADMADINNDGFNDIFITEMLPSDYQRLKSVTTFEDWNKYQLKLSTGYYHQFTRNTLQLNNSNNSFSEVGRLSGVEASDWSWGALIFDMDNDGLKDLFIANGAYKDLTDQDYLQYISSEEILRSMIANDTVNYSKLIEIIPSNPLKNHAYRNKGNLSFEDYKASGLQTESFSNGAAYGDLDNDGDLDLVVNNLNMESFVYRNNTNEQQAGHYIKFDLKGEGKNTFAIGSKIEIKNLKIIVENQPVRGFQSSIDIRPNIGLKNNDLIDAKITWPSGKITNLSNIAVDSTYTLFEKNATLEDRISGNQKKIFAIQNNTVDYFHEENRFSDFDRERLLSHMCSTEGPKGSMGDVNSDGIKDLFIGGSKGYLPTILMGTKEGFENKNQPDFEKNKGSEDAGSIFFDADNDGDLDLYVCSGGIEFSQSSPSFMDRLYFNDGQGNFTLSDQRLPTKIGVHSTSTVEAADIDADGDLDLFVGERVVPLKYGTACSGFILKNDGNGQFMDITAEIAPYLQNIGMITDAVFEDFDQDGDQDLIVVGEFMPIEILENNNGKFTPLDNPDLKKLRGWWNTIEKADLDGDGDQDFIVGNLGLNSRFRATSEKPVTLYSNDFDGNGFTDPILAFKADNGKDYPYALRHDLTAQIKKLTKKFPSYESFKNADITTIFSPEELAGTTIVQANTFASIIIINEGQNKFKVQELPIEAQYSSTYAISAHDFDSDGDMDLILGGNLFGVKPEMGRYDASYGTYLENMGTMNFKAHPDGNGFHLNGEIRDLFITQNTIIATRNSDSLGIFKF